MEQDSNNTEFLRKKVKELESELTSFKKREKDLVNQVDELQKQIAVHNQRNMQQAGLQANEEKYRSLFNNAPLGMFRSTPEGRFIEVNYALARMLGYDTPEEVIENIHDISKQVYVEQGKREKIILHAQKSMVIQYYENIYKRLDGSHFVANLYLRTVKDEQNEVAYLEGMVEDLSHKMKVNEILKRKEERLVKLNTILHEAEHLSDFGSFEWDIKKDILTFSSGWQKIHGFYENKVPIEKIKELAHPDDLPVIEHLSEDAIMGIRDFRIEHRIFHKLSGEIRYIKVRAKVTFDDNKEPLKMYGSVQDITKQKQHEQSLRESEKKYRFLAESTSELICLHDPDGIYRYVSPSVKKMLGYEIAELEGKDPYTFFHPKDTDKIRQESHNIALAGKPVTGVEYRIRKKDGSYTWFDSYTDVIFDEKGKVKSFISRSRDISDKINSDKILAENEAKYRSITNDVLNNSAIGMFLLDSEFNVVWVNRKLEDLFQLSRETIIGKDKRKLVTEHICHLFEYPEKFKRKILATYEDNTYVEHFHCRIHPGDPKKERWLEHWSQPIFLGHYKHGRIEYYTDITDRIRFERELKHSQYQLTIALEGAAADSWELDLINKKLTYSESWINRLGYTTEELSHDVDEISVIFHPEDLKKSWEHLNDYLSGKKAIYESESRVKTKDGNWIWILSRGRIFERNENGIPVRMVGINFDITERKVAENALAESEERFRAAFVQDNSVKMIIDPDNGKILEANNAATKFYGYNLDELTNMYIQDINLLTEEDVSQHMAEAFEIRKTHFSFKHKLSNGNIRDVEVYSAPIEYHGKKRLFSIIYDVTEKIKAEDVLRKSEERLKLAEQAGEIGHYEIDITTGKAIWSDELYRIFGFVPGEFDPDVQSYQNLLHPDDVEKVMGLFEECIHEHKDFDLEYRFIRKDRTIRYIHSKAYLIYDDNEEPLAMFGTIQDITDRKSTENELRYLNATKDKFFSIIAHDLTNPFNSLLGFSNLLQKQIDSGNTAKVKEYSRLIQQTASHSFELLTNLLEWSRSQTGRIAFEPEDIQLSKLVARVFSLSNAVASGKKIKLSTNIDADVQVLADRNMLMTILRNLISNGIKFSNEGGEISISAKVLQNEVVISITDTGIGMTNETVKKLFLLDGHSSTPGTNNEKGTGLGLIISKEFVEQHNGKIWVESKPGSGTTFYFSLSKTVAQKNS